MANNIIVNDCETTYTAIRDKEYSVSVNISSGIMSNCKVGIIGGIDSVNYRGQEKRTDEQQKELIDRILAKGDYRTLFGTATNEDAVKFLQKHYNLIYCIKIPMGYYDKFQWHILIDFKLDKKYRDRLKKEGCRRLPTKLRY